MDFDDIKRQQLAARQFSVSAGHATFTLQIPTEFEKRLSYLTESGGRKFDSVTMIKVQRSMLLRAIVGWSGVQVKDALPDFAGDDTFAFEAGAAEVLMDAQTEWEETLSTALFERITSDKAAKDTAAKN